MTVPDHFQFSQGSLQDYADCPRRFQLKYIERLAWPALQVEPALENERYLQQGADFHRLVQQRLLGVPTQRLDRLAAKDHDLARWWDHFNQDQALQAMFAQEELRFYPELSLSAPYEGFRLVGKFDLLVTGPDGKATIYDWKTSRKQPKRAWLAENLQTRVYPYLLLQAGSEFNQGQAFAPAQIEMIYWFADFPAAPIHFVYSAEQQARDLALLQTLIAEIKTLGSAPAMLTDQAWRCKYCVYRSHCNRGLAAGRFDEFEGEVDADDFEFSLNYEQIAEIEF